MSETVTPEALAPALHPRQERVRRLLRDLAASPPQVLLLEGGKADERVAMSLYWALVLNCQGSSGHPCLNCETCLRIMSLAHRDLFFFDGRAESIKIEQMRELRPLLGQPPHDLIRRVVILAEAQELTVPAANSLLKSLEEPCQSTVFVLLAPQRERLLPTLVSRSWVMTMAWPRCEPEAEGLLAEWETALAGFLVDGRGWFPRTMTKSSVDRELARAMVRQLRGRLRQAMSGSVEGSMAGELEAMGPEGRRSLDLLLVEAQYALDAQVSPVLVLDWMATQIFRISRS